MAQRPNKLLSAKGSDYMKISACCSERSTSPLRGLFPNPLRSYRASAEVSLFYLKGISIGGKNTKCSECRIRSVRSQKVWRRGANLLPASRDHLSDGGFCGWPGGKQKQKKKTTEFECRTVILNMLYRPAVDTVAAE